MTLIRPRHQLATEHHDPVKLLRATPYNKKPKRSKTTAQLADRNQASIVANQICRLKNHVLGTFQEFFRGWIVTNYVPSSTDSFTRSPEIGTHETVFHQS